ncbi:unnamed protein product, partial [Laminaria digitata]
VHAARVDSKTTKTRFEAAAAAAAACAVCFCYCFYCFGYCLYCLLLMLLLLLLLLPLLLSLNQKHFYVFFCFNTTCRSRPPPPSSIKRLPTPLAQSGPQCVLLTEASP